MQNFVPKVGHLLSSDKMGSLRYPAGVTKADITKQKRASWLSAVRYYYEDETFPCRDCGKVEVWTVAQQRRWYEIQGGSPESVAVRCKQCRKKEANRQPEPMPLKRPGPA